MKSNYFVTSIYTKYGEHIWSFQGAEQDNPKKFASSQAASCGDRVAARQIRKSSSIVRVFD